MTPTPVADNISGAIKAALHLLNTSLNEGEVFVPGSSGKTFRFSVYDYDEAILVPKLMQQLAVLAPGVSIECYAVPRKDLESELTSGSLDFALDVPLFSAPQLCRQRLATERYVCMVRPDHPVAGLNLTLERYLELEHIHVSGRRKGIGHVDIALEMLGRTRNIRLRMKNYMAGPQVVSTTDLALTLPRNLAAMYPMKVFEMPFNVETLDQYLYWHKSADQDQASIWMRTLLLGLLPCS
jgi:DNA-binding transcriptional LysR family regulator